MAGVAAAKYALTKAMNTNVLNIILFSFINFQTNNLLIFF